MAYGTKVIFSTIREIDFGSVTSNYISVGSSLDSNARQIRFVNQLDQQLYISLDSSTDNIRMSANSFLLLDLSSNKVREDGLFISIGTTFYVKSVSSLPTSGSFWIESISATGGV